MWDVFPKVAFEQQTRMAILRFQEHGSFLLLDVACLGCSCLS